MFNRKVFYDCVRGSLFHGAMTQGQVDGMDDILSAWEANPRSDNLRWLSYPLATAAHETGFTMQPIAEYGLGKGMDTKPDPETGNVFYGRGYVQLTWKENYQRADAELGFGNTKDDPTSCEWYPDNQLKAEVAAETMYQGMVEGWFRGDSKGRQTLERYFSDTVDDSWTAREVINGDKTKVPSWSGGVNIGNLIKGYHIDFLAALEASAAAWVPPLDDGHTLMSVTLGVELDASGQVVKVNVLEFEPLA